MTRSHSSLQADSPTTNGSVPTSFSYTPVFRNPLGSAQISPASSRTTLLIPDKELDLSACETQGCPSLSFSLTRLQFLCYFLHAVLVAIHVVLLALRIVHIDQRVMIPESRANFYSILLTVIQQAFFTVYQGALVVITQSLALRSNLLRQQTLTALHDKSAAWGGLGASLLGIWRQRTTPAAVFGTLGVALYLSCISILHVSSSSLLAVETFQSTNLTQIQTNLALPNMSAVMQVFSIEDWNTLGLLTSSIGQLQQTSGSGLVNNTVYDILTDTTGIGNTSVNATSWYANCYSALSAAPGNYSGAYTVWENLNGTQFSSYYPLYEGALWAASDSTSVDTTILYGPLVEFFAFPPIADANGDVGSTFAASGEVNTALATGQESQILVENQQQIMVCALSYEYRQATIDARTNALLGLSPTEMQVNAEWSTEIPNMDELQADPMMNWFLEPFNYAAASTNTIVSPSTSCINVECGISALNLNLMELAGLQINRFTYTSNRENTNVTDLVNQNTTLAQMETALSIIAARLVWTMGHVSVNNASESILRQFGTAEVANSVLLSHLQINIVPVSVGLGISTVLFVLALSMTSDVKNGGSHHVPNSAGILQMLWLFSRQSGVWKMLHGVPEPDEGALRAAGMIDLCIPQDKDKLSSSVCSTP
ncbi:hypothetical protein BS17DRAFT_319284 [Gyrodon lividus]|nr:hypothetical protein BS17DRAFT_319284 [Gyrodon lividus]